MDTSRFPAENISWNDAQEFLKKLNETVKLPPKMTKGKLDLPHEDEWEYACRGGGGNSQAYYFGNKLNGSLANVNGREPFGTSVKGPFLNRTTEVGSYEKVARHPWGLCDMCGNVNQGRFESFIVDAANPFPLRGSGGEYIDPYEPAVPPEDWEVYWEDAVGIAKSGTTRK